MRNWPSFIHPVAERDTTVMALGNDNRVVVSGLDQGNDIANCRRRARFIKDCA